MVLANAPEPLISGVSYGLDISHHGADSRLRYSKDV